VPIRLAFVLGGVLLGIATLAGLELLLALLGVGEQGARHDPFAGFSRTVPFFEPATRVDGTPIHQLSVARSSAAALRGPHEPQREFLASKREGAFRVFVVGGSSAQGIPYSTRYAFSTWLAERLAVALPEYEVEMVNAAMTGYASRRVLSVVREIAQYEPDLLVIMSGHNENAETRYFQHLIDMDPRLFRAWEFVVGTRLFALFSPWFGDDFGKLGGEAPAIDLTPERNQMQMFEVHRDRTAGKGYASQRDLAYRDLLYEFNLEEMLRSMEEAGSRVLFVSLVQNLSDWAPGASLHRSDISEDEQRRWRVYFAEGERLADSEGDCDAALAAWSSALAIDDRHAGLHFRMATCQRSLGRLGEAREHFRLASDLDAVPLGAPGGLNEIARSVAHKHGIPFVDLDPVLEEASGERLVGDDLFTDFVHPNIRAHQLIAARIAEALRDEGIPVPASEWREAGGGEGGQAASGGYRDPDVASIYRAEPGLTLQEARSRLVICWVTRSRPCFDASLAEVVAIDPDDNIARRLERRFD
jgi:lysophospholipase L1-like esterase